MKSLALGVQKLWPWFKFLWTNRRKDGQDKTICPRIYDYGGIKIIIFWQKLPGVLRHPNPHACLRVCSSDRLDPEWTVFYSQFCTTMHALWGLFFNTHFSWTTEMEGICTLTVVMNLFWHGIYVHFYWYFIKRTSWNISYVRLLWRIYVHSSSSLPEYCSIQDCSSLFSNDLR